jgi:tetratricopeptide (TPR) repeat protein
LVNARNQFAAAASKRDEAEIHRQLSSRVKESVAMESTPNRYLRRRLCCVAFALAAGGWAGLSTAQWPMNPTKEEIALLPAYCTHVQFGYGATPEGYARWRSIYGDMYHGMHHYCYSFIYSMRADRYGITPQVRDHNLGNAFREIQYMVERTPTDHELFPEMLTKQGTIQCRLNKRDEAVALFKRAAELNPAYWRSYYELAECHLAGNRQDEARAALQEGLKHAPNARGLSVMLDELQSRAKGRAPQQATSKRETPQ